MPPAIKVENLSKLCRIGQRQAGYRTFREAIVDTVSAPFRSLRRLFSPQSAIHNPKSNDTIWALKDVSFEVQPGEVVGIIGRNGAGKSMLLKILSRITEPTEGRVELRGRVSSLLEVGTGFHPELTGRENIYLNGAILGMTKAEIKRKFDEIVAFAEIEKFIDTPVKHYSSGMYVRLAFAVAAHLEPEILLVDEVLAVGDAAFQKKCLGKMGDVTREGRTVLFVSHNMGAINRLCVRSILLSGGRLVFDGLSEVAVRKYLEDIIAITARRVRFQDDPSLPIAIREVAIISPDKSEQEPLDTSDALNVEIKYSVKEDVKGTNISFALKKDGVVLFRSWDIDSDSSIFEKRYAGEYISTLRLPKGLLNTGSYSIYVAAGRPGIGPIITHDDCLQFDLENNLNDTSHMSHSRGGALIIPIEWVTRKLDG